MDNLPRLSFYLSGTLIVSGAFTLLTNDLIPKVNEQGLIGFLFLIGFGLIYMNITFVISRRFMRRLDGPSNLPFVFSFLVAIVPLFWNFIINEGIFESLPLMYLGNIIFTCFLGGFLGQKAGIKAQIIFKEQLYQYLQKSGQLPEDLKRAHDNLFKN